MTAPSNIQLLNGIQSIIIDFANREGIALSDHFATVADFKGFVVAFAFKQFREMGIEIDKAFDMTLGDGAFQEMYDRLCAA